MINGFSKFKYETRLKKLGLTTLETRRLRGDLIQVFKIVKGYNDIGEDIFFVGSKSSLRGHQLKLQKSVRLDIAKYSFSNRVVNEWNNLSKEVISHCHGVTTTCEVSTQMIGYLMDEWMTCCKDRKVNDGRLDE